MPKMTIRIHPPLTQWFGFMNVGKRVILEKDFEPGDCIRDVIFQLAEQYPAFRANGFEPETDELTWDTAIAVNEEMLIDPDAFDQPLEDGTRIDLFPGYAGG